MISSPLYFLVSQLCHSTVLFRLLHWPILHAIHLHHPSFIKSTVWFCMSSHAYFFPLVLHINLVLRSAKFVHVLPAEIFSTSAILSHNFSVTIHFCAKLVT